MHARTHPPADHGRDPQISPASPTRQPIAAAIVGDLQSKLSNRQLARLAAQVRTLARQPVDAPEQPYVEGPFGGELTQTEQLAAYYRLGAHQVESDLKGVTASESLSERARLWVDEVQAMADSLGSGKSRQLTKSDVERWELLWDEGAELRTDIAWAADEPARAAARRAAAEAERLAEEVKRLAPKMADSARAAFRAGDEDLLSSLADITGNVLDIGLGIQELSREIASKAASMSGTQLPAIGKYTEALGKLNKGLALVNLALSVSGKKGKTDLDEGLRWVGISAGAFSSLGTIAGLPAHMGLYANLYLVPLTKACIAGVQRIAEYRHEENKSWVEFIGEPGNYMVEPGGKPMWQFMVSVMRADEASDVPTPPAKVAEYFMDHRDDFNAGVGGHTGMPTTGWVFKDLDTSKFSSWVYYRRKQVWALLYGSMKVPAK